MKIFSVGPVEMHESTKAIGAMQNEYFRTPAFSDFMFETSDLLKETLDAPDDSHPIFLTCSGTGAMDATIMNCFSSQDKVLVVNGGTFGKYFVNICGYQKIPYIEIYLEFGEVLTLEMLENHVSEGTTALLINIHESSTGQLYDLDMVSDFCAKHNLYLIVDAISSVFADEFYINKYDIDATIISSQKALALPPGLAIVMLSNRIYNERVICNSVSSMYFDFKLYVKDLKRGQTPFTPAIGILRQLHGMLKELIAQGVENKIAQTKELAEHFRLEAKGIGLSIPAYPLSNALTPLVFDSIDARDVVQALRDDFKAFINPNGYMPERICRVGHLGDIDKKDLDLLVVVLKEVVAKLSEY